VFVTDATQSEIVNNDAACYAVTVRRASDEADGCQRLATRSRVAGLQADVSEANIVAVQEPKANGEVGRDVARNVSVTDTNPSEIANKDAGCYEVTHSRTEIGGSHGLQSVMSEPRAN